MLQEILKSWGLTQVQVQTNYVVGCKKELTDPEKVSNVVESWHLYLLGAFPTIGHLASIRDGKASEFGHLVKWADGSFTVYHGRIRYDLAPDAVTIST